MDAAKIFKLHYTNQIPINALDFSTAYIYTYI